MASGKARRAAGSCGSVTRELTLPANAGSVRVQEKPCL
jgi:hypothetical protein